MLGQRATNCQQRKNDIDRLTTLDKLYGNLSVSTDTGEPREDFGAIRSQSSLSFDPFPSTKTWNLSGTTFWADAIAKEMKTVFVAFEILPEDKQAPPGHTFIKCHLVFDLKSNGSMIRKARFVAGGHMTGEPECLTYASVVSRESI